MEQDQEQAQAEDEVLVRRFQADPQGSAGRGAAGELIARWQVRVYSWCFRILREREAALDAAQESLTRMYIALPRYEGRGRFSAWLFTIVHNQCIGQVRPRPLTRDSTIDVDWLRDEGPGPDREFESAELERRVLEAMERELEPNERMAVWLRAFEGVAVDEITVLMDLQGAAGARSMLQSARKKLRAALRPARGPREGTS